MIGLRKIRRSKRFRSIYPLTTINSLPFFRVKTKLQRSRNKNSNHGGGGSSDLHSPLSFCNRSASNANSTAYATHSPCRLAMQNDINNKKGDKIFNKIHDKSFIYRLSPVRKGREEDIVLYINVHREISAFFTIMDHFSNAFDANISNLHH